MQDHQVTSLAPVLNIRRARAVCITVSGNEFVKSGATRFLPVAHRFSTCGSQLMQNRINGSSAPSFNLINAKGSGLFP